MDLFDVYDAPDPEGWTRALITRRHQLSPLFREVKKAKLVAIDCETTGLDWRRDTVVGVAFAVRGLSWYVDTARSEIKLDELRWIFDSDVPKVFHNAKFDLHMLGGSDAVADPIEDTQIMAHLIDPERENDKLKNLAVEVLGRTTDEQAALADYRQRYHLPKDDFSSIPPGYMYRYACADVEFTLDLFARFNRTIQKRYAVLYKQEIRLIRTLLRCEDAGMAIDLPHFEKMRAEQGAELERLLSQFELEYEGVNLGSWQQILKYMAAHDIKMPDGKVPPNTKAETLEKIEHPFPKAILAVRGIEKEYKTYVCNILNLQVDGRISSNLKQDKARTGRMSSSQPPQQNLPKKGKVRQGYINPGVNTQLLFLDYKQIEMVIFAEYSQDPTLVNAVLNRHDLHQATGQRLMAMIEGVEVSLDQVPEKWRKDGKTINFAIIYGIGKEKLANDLGVTEERAAYFKKQYLRAIPGAATFTKVVENEIRAKGRVINLYGRTRPFVLDEAYIGVNTVIQGSAADIIKQAMNRVDEFLLRNNYKTRLVLQVHDELIFEHHLDEPIIPALVHLMTAKLPMKLPLRVDVGASSTNWTEEAELTDRVMLDRLLASDYHANLREVLQTPSVDWDSIGARGLEIESPYFRDTVWLVKEATGQDRLEIVV